MARFRDESNFDDRWIHDLARGEWLAASGEQNTDSMEPELLIEESAINLLTELKDKISQYAKIFNALSEQGAKYAEIKVYNLAQGTSDFMVFRNQLKMIVRLASQGQIQVQFLSHAATGNLATPRVNVQQRSQEQIHELQANLGPFREVFWTYQGERVNPGQLSKFYFGEFVRLTRQSRSHRGKNQVLFEQLKALLDQKGLDL